MTIKNLRVIVVGLPNAGKTTFINTICGTNLKTANFSGSTTGILEISIKRNINGEDVIYTFFDVPGFESFEVQKNDLESQAVSLLKAENYDYILHIVNSEFSYFSSVLDKEIRQNLKKPVITAINFPSITDDYLKTFNDFSGSILFSAVSKKNCQKILEFITLKKGAESKNINLLEVSKSNSNSTKITQNIDKILISKIFGIPIFFGIMFLIFWLSFVIGGEIGEFLGSGFDIVINFTKTLPFLGPFAKAFTESVLIGVGTVVGFTPIIVLCATLINLLEQTGYIARVCFLLDKFFDKFNLGGKSLIPLIIGAGCSISAYMSARMISDPREKFLTMVIIGFIPCTAKLAVFMLFSAALFGEAAPIAISVIYLLGFIVGLTVAKLLGLFYPGKSEKTKIELFNYRLPILKNVIRTAYTRTFDYLKNAATLIAGFAAILSFITLVGFQDGKFIILENGMENSLAAIFAKFIIPFFIPLGLDWKMIVSLVTAIAAKEVAITTLAVLYSTSAEGLLTVISHQIGMRQAATYLTFMFFYLPCVSATLSFHRENKSGKKTTFLILFTTILAYFSSTAVNLIFKLLE